jgi:hypothetical protein
MEKEESEEGRKEETTEFLRWWACGVVSLFLYVRERPHSKLAIVGEKERMCERDEGETKIPTDLPTPTYLRLPIYLLTHLRQRFRDVYCRRMSPGCMDICGYIYIYIYIYIYMLLSRPFPSLFLVLLLLSPSHHLCWWSGLCYLSWGIFGVASLPIYEKIFTSRKDGWLAGWW